MKYIVEAAGELPKSGCLAEAVPLITCGSCHWAGRPNDLGFRSCYWDPRRGKIYPEDYYCKLATIEGEQDVPPDDRCRWFETCPSAEVPNEAD